MADSEDDISKYRRGKLDSKASNALERKALSDPFTQDALEGSEFISADDFSSDVSELSKKLREKSASRWISPWRIAAGIFIVIGAGSLFFLVDLQDERMLSMNKSNESGLKETVHADTTIYQKTDSPKSLLSLNKPEEDKSADKQPRERKSKSLKKEAPAPEMSSSGQAADISQSEIAEEEKVKEDAVVVKEDDRIVQRSEALPAVVNQDAKKKLAEIQKDKLSESRSELTSDKKEQLISGQVVSSEGGGLPGVNVLIKGTAIGTVTDIDGKFKIHSPVPDPQIVFSFIGFSTLVIKGEPEKSMNVVMSEDQEQLSEVVVVGYRAQRSDEEREPVTKSAYPDGGIRAYNKYLENNVRYPVDALESNIKGKVTVEFTISTAGLLSDFTIMKGLGHGCDEEVVRLVKEGPKWHPSTIDKEPVETQVRVKVKFDPDKARKK